jgi:hypothetical protein
MIMWLEDESTGSEPSPANQMTVKSKDPAVVGSVFHVILRLVDGERVLAGTYPDADQAHCAAKELLDQFAQADAAWPHFDSRYVRPGAVVSIDLVEEEHRRWGGSPDRAKIMDTPEAAA